MSRQRTEGVASKARAVRHTIRPHPYLLPPPHRLGTSFGLRPSRIQQDSSSLVFFQPHIHTQITSKAGFDESDSGTQPRTLPHAKAQITSKAGFDDPDSGTQPRAQKSDTLPRAEAKTRPRPVVESHDGKALRDFVLFLPPKLPQAISQSSSALSEYVYSTTITHLSLWELASNLETLDLRFPPSYSHFFREEHHFLSQFLSAVFEHLEHVQSVGKLYLPEILLHSRTQLEEVLQPLAKTTFSVSHTFIPVDSSLQDAEVSSLDFKALASFLSKRKVEEVTFVSSNSLISKFQPGLQAEMKKLKRVKVKLSFSSEELEEAGPAYITDLGRKAPAGEVIGPHTLVGSLNFTTERDAQEHGGGERKRRPSKKQRAEKEKAKRAVSTDCTYIDEAELSVDGPFPSQIWNLDRLFENGIDGTGMTIAVIDSGINYTHPAFKNKIIAVRNFVCEEIDDIDCAIDSDGHGTHCAGIAAGTSFYCPLNSSDPTSPSICIPPGVAPGAKLVICKVVSTASGEVDTEAFLNALKWIKEFHTSGTRIDVVSISLASTYFSNERAEVISELTSMGIIIICCASNVGRLRLQPIAFPARLGHVLCIGAHDENGKPTSFSPVGRELDFLAPGDSIWGPGPGTVGPFAMDCASGTSCATPAVAGLVCLVLQAVARICESNPKKYRIAGKLLIDFVRSVWVMREILKEMSSSLGHHSEEIGYGTLNPYRILDRSPEEIMRVINEIIEDE